MGLRSGMSQFNVLVKLWVKLQAFHLREDYAQPLDFARRTTKRVLTTLE